MENHQRWSGIVVFVIEYLGGRGREVRRWRPGKAAWLFTGESELCGKSVSQKENNIVAIITILRESR